MILALLGAANAITYRPIGPPKTEAKMVEFDEDDERDDIQQSIQSLATTE